MEVKISVIIPAYNVAGYVARCLDSVLAQTFASFEVILIDDGSTDGTGQILDEYAKKDSRITLVHKENGGVSIARNTGIQLAKGEYYLFFDGDDFAEPYCLAELYQLVKDKRADSVIYGYYRWENNTIKEVCLPIFQKELYEGEEIRQSLLPRFIGLSYDSINDWINHRDKALYVENPALWRILVSARIIREHRLSFHEELKVGEDTIFISEYLCYAARCYVIQKCYYYLVTRETSAIYQYEKNPMAKLEGKLKLTARKELTKRIRERCGFDMDGYWRGTVLMSCVEIAFLLARKSTAHSFCERYRMFRGYASLAEVRKTIHGFEPVKKWNIKALPFGVLKRHLYLALFLCAKSLQLIHYEFKRT